MWDLIGDILTGVATGLSGAEGAAPDKSGGKPSGLGLPVAIVGALGVTASVCAMFFQEGNLWQIAKLMLLAAILAVCSAAGFHAFRERRRVRARQRVATHAAPSKTAKMPARTDPATLHVLGPQPGAATTTVAAVRFNLQEEVARLFDDASLPPDGNPTAVIVMGGVATGKTTFRKQRYPRGYVLIDAAEIFLHLSQGQTLPFPGPFRMAMDVIGRFVAHRALAERRNVVTEIIGAEGDSARQLIESLQSLGYAVRAEVITCDMAEALRRNATRGPDDVSAYYAEPFQREWILTACAELAGAREA